MTKLRLASNLQVLLLKSYWLFRKTLKLEARYNNLLPVIVKAIQEVNEAKDKELHQLKLEKDKEIDELKARIQSLEELVNKVLENKKP